ncbi:MAG: biopolymer transporter ExbD [Chitinophagales bacterium]|nr:biopolymer transporter ExbD [Chitinophagales bacterium]HAE14456.1 biopolymer transporter ExbD [Bacteroidota bacterium]MCB9021464.1 biopolymer transporter ExbD [Chitinophagales bacterium]MCB9032019.1 biopolymer transporter ExbD [Chitinophagales bacterium]HAE34378.1 biopolymer transporter ExbD [Bacteroidota bacterium]
MPSFVKKPRQAPGINTASLPDIVFILLFFFMVATRMRETDIKVKQVLPQATEMEKLEKKDLLSYIYIGAPEKRYQKELGTAPRLQLNDQLADVEDIAVFVEAEKEKMPDENRAKIIMALKVDKEVNVGIISDVKTELRKANALKLTYITNKRMEEN